MNEPYTIDRFISSHDYYLSTATDALTLRENIAGIVRGKKENMMKQVFHFYLQIYWCQFEIISTNKII